MLRFQYLVSVRDVLRLLPVFRDVRYWMPMSAEPISQKIQFPVPQVNSYSLRRRLALGGEGEGDPQSLLIKRGACLNRYRIDSEQATKCCNCGRCTVSWIPDQNISLTRRLTKSHGSKSFLKETKQVMMLWSSRESTRLPVTIDVKVTDVLDMTPCKQTEVYGRVFSP